MPSETQSREFDAKLLLALVLAEQGHPVIVGSRMAIHNAIHRFEPGVYVAKDFRKPSNRIFRILSGLGHRIVAWDEEAVLFFNAKEFHERRVDPATFAMVEELYAWGPENASYLATAPGYRSEVPIRQFGNPRLDMLRSELVPYYTQDIARLRTRFGKFVLINTNFGKLNHAVSSYVVKPGGTDKSVGGTITPFMEKAWAHRLAIFNSFKQLVPALAQALPDHSIIVRPHPAENHQTWRDVAQGFGNVHVLHEGPVQVWMLAAEAMVHNGCTTGIESYLVGAPVISFQAHENPELDFALSNDLGVKATRIEDVVRLVLAGPAALRPTATAEDKAARLGRFFSGLAGPLASDKMAAAMSAFAHGHAAAPGPASTRLRAHVDSRLRAATKWLASYLPDHKNSKAYSLQRFPGVDQAGVTARIQRFQHALGRFEKARSEQIADNIFRIF